MPCALCQLNRELCKSHVLPEFIYEPIYDKKHRFTVASFSEKDISDNYSQIGLREKLLCKECETQFSRYEEYAKGFIFGGAKIKAVRSGNSIKITGLDYQNFKLFGLSILWRASITKQDFFAAVDLGPRHEGKLRIMLNREDPGTPSQYGCFLVGIEKEKDDPNQLPLSIIKPTPYRYEGHNCYRFVFGGIVWMFFVSQHAIPKTFCDSFINEKGEMVMGLSKMNEIRFIRKALQDMAGKFNKAGWNEKTGRLEGRGKKT